MHGFQQGGKLPPLPMPVLKVMAPVVIRAEFKMNEVTDDAVRADLAALPEHLDKIDGLIADGVIGGDSPNAADLQIAGSVRLLLTFADLREGIDARPAGRLARRLMPRYPGDMGAGTLPSEWIPRLEGAPEPSAAPA
jgi:glutathione S-transferase